MEYKILKAKDYYEKYKDKFTGSTDDFVNALCDLCSNLIEEAEHICMMRNIKLLRGQVSVFKEQNQKANAIARMFNPPVLQRDFFLQTLKTVKNPVVEYWNK